jgi:hypothetical protein
MVMSEVAVYCLKQRSQLNIAQFRLQRTHQRLERKPRVLNINQAIPKCLIESAGVLAQGEDVIVRAEFDDGPSYPCEIVPCCSVRNPGPRVESIARMKRELVPGSWSSEFRLGGWERRGKGGRAAGKQ